MTSSSDCPPESVDAAMVSSDEVRVGHMSKEMIEAYEQGLS